MKFRHIIPLLALAGPLMAVVPEAHAQSSMDPEKQKLLYAEAQLRLLKDLPAIPIRIYYNVFVRQPYIDLGYKPLQTMCYGYHLTEKTRILKH